MQKINWADHVRNEEVLHAVNKERNTVYKTEMRTDMWIGHISEGKAEGDRSDTTTRKEI
jgi:hypothetical protein